MRFLAANRMWTMNSFLPRWIHLWILSNKGSPWKSTPGWIHMARNVSIWLSEKKSTTIPLQCAGIKVWEDSHGEVEKDMKQVLFLPHEILGSMISAGRLDLVAGTSVTQPNFMWRKAHQKKTRFPIQSLKRLQVAAMLAPRHYRNSGTTCGTPRGSKTIRF